MNVCFIITIAMAMLFRDFRPCGIIFMTVLITLDFPIMLDGDFTGVNIFIFPTGHVICAE